MMNPEVKAKWLDALRSGRYEQGRMELRTTVYSNATAMRHRYCCLGVLCQVYSAETGLGEWTGPGYEVNGRVSSGVLPREVSDWAGLVERNPVVPDSISDRNGNVTLAGMNDGGMTFAAIANIIEAHL